MALKIWKTTPEEDYDVTIKMDMDGFEFCGAVIREEGQKIKFQWKNTSTKETGCVSMFMRDTYARHVVITRSWCTQKELTFHIVEDPKIPDDVDANCIEIEEVWILQEDKHLLFSNVFKNLQPKNKC